MRSPGVTLMMAACATACSSSAGKTPPDLGPIAHPIVVPAETQRSGDAAAGYHALVNDGYVGCGLPYSLYMQVFGTAPLVDQLPDRDGHNATLPYGQTAFTQPSGVEVVTANCLTCHAAKLARQGRGRPRHDLAATSRRIRRRRSSLPACCSPPVQKRWNGASSPIASKRSGPTPWR